MLADDYTTICLQLSPMMSRCRQCRWQRREIDFDSRSALVHRSDRSRRCKFSSVKFATYFTLEYMPQLLTVPSAAKSRDRPRSGFHHSNESHLCIMEAGVRGKKTQFELMNKICNGNEDSFYSPTNSASVSSSLAAMWAPSTEIWRITTILLSVVGEFTTCFSNSYTMDQPDQGLKF